LLIITLLGRIFGGGKQLSKII